MGIITIKKAKLQDNMFIETTYEDSVGNNIINTITRKSTAPVHDDLRTALHKLDAHLALICEEIVISGEWTLDEAQRRISSGLEETEDKDLFGEPIFKKLACFSATGFTLGGSGEDEGVCIIGRKELSTGKVMNMVSPFHKFEDDMYVYAQELAQAVDAIKYEIEEFIVNGKQAPDRQLSLEFEDEAAEVEFEE